MTDAVQVNLVKILRAFKNGDVVFLECDRAISKDAYKHFMDHIDTLLKDTGVRVVVLGDGIRVAAAEEKTEIVPE